MDKNKCPIFEKPKILSQKRCFCDWNVILASGHQKNNFYFVTIKFFGIHLWDLIIFLNTNFYLNLLHLIDLNFLIIKSDLDYNNINLHHRYQCFENILQVDRYQIDNIFLLIRIQPLLPCCRRSLWTRDNSRCRKGRWGLRRLRAKRPYLNLYHP